jgi:hypothetical protein
MESFGKKLSVTILFYDFTPSEEAVGRSTTVDRKDGSNDALHLVISTSGFYSPKNGRLMLPPRSPLAHVKTPDLEDCVMVGGRFVMDSKFILLLEWGDYKNL